MEHKFYRHFAIREQLGTILFQLRYAAREGVTPHSREGKGSTFLAFFIHGSYAHVNACQSKCQTFSEK